MNLPDSDVVLLALTTGLGKFGSNAQNPTQKDFRALEAYVRETGLPMGILLYDETLLDDAPMSSEGKRRARSCLARAESLETEYAMFHSMGARYLLQGDAHYPARLMLLGEEAPAVLFYYGNVELLREDGVAVAGSRRLQHTMRRAAWRIGAQCAREDLVLFSGGACGIDAAAESENLLQGGRNVTVLADGFFVNRNHLRRKKAAIYHSRQLLLCLYHPTEPFHAFTALRRNHLLYAMGKIALTLASGDGKGGSFAGASQNLRQGWTPQYVLDFPDAPPGNARLMDLGAQGISAETLYAPGFSLRALIGQNEVEKLWRR